MRRFVLVFLSLSFALGKEYTADFLGFKQKYSRTYTSEEEERYRYNIFVENMKDAERLAILNPLATFGVTKFSDLSKEEFSQFYLQPNLKPVSKIPNSPYVGEKPQIIPDPKNWDWCAQGGDICTPIYTQGQCGSCWALSSVEIVETYWALAGNKLTAFSTEQVLDCVVSNQSFGCGGGWEDDAYHYIQEYGLEPLSVYPYIAINGSTGNCDFDKSKVVGHIKSYSTLPNGENYLYQHVSEYGPVNVGVDATDWQSYTGGVLTTCTNDVNHSCFLAGYAKYGENGSYWIVRNQWGEDWGINGYIWIAIGNNLCDIGVGGSVVVV